MVSAIIGAFLTVDILDFVFIYLYLGCLVGLAISMAVHRLIAMTTRESKEETGSGAKVEGKESTRGLTMEE